LAATTPHAVTVPRMKLTREIMPAITTPDSVETRPGTMQLVK
jgi:hypothetical protein